MKGRRSAELCRVALGFCIVALLGSVAHAAEENWTFGYDEHKPDGPEHWGGLHPEWALCKDGREQSPISILTPGSNGIGCTKTLTVLNTSYVPAKAELFQSGHALEVDVVDGSAGHFFLNGEDYLLTQFHFHAPSEHVIDGVQAPLEMHMVHTTADGSKFAVIGLPFMHGPPSPFLNEFWDKLEELTPDTGAGVPPKRVDIGTLVIDEPHLKLGPKYARYDGSLTTPGCTESITWTVCLEEWNTISHDQLEALEKLFPEPFARPLQKLHGRSVQFYEP